MNAPNTPAVHWNGVGVDHDWSSLVLIKVVEDGAELNAPPIGYVFVIEPQKENALHKCAGGHRKKCAVPPETPDVTGAREVLGETHLKLRPEELSYLGKQWKRNHWAVYFSGVVRRADLAGMCSYHPENEGEVPKFFTNEEFRELLAQNMFLRLHLVKLQEYGELQGF